MDIDMREVRAIALKLGKNSGGSGATAAAAVRRTAYAIERDAKVLCPVDTGALRNSISTSFEGDGRFRGITAEIGPTAEYGLYVEEGTSRMSGQPYLGPSYDKNIGGLQTALAAIDPLK